MQIQIVVYILVQARFLSSYLYDSSDDSDNDGNDNSSNNNSDSICKDNINKSNIGSRTVIDNDGKDGAKNDPSIVSSSVGVKRSHHRMNNDGLVNNGSIGCEKVHCLTDFSDSLPYHFFPNCYNLSDDGNPALSLTARGTDLDLMGNEGINHQFGSNLLNHPKLKVKMGYVGIYVIVDGTFEPNMTVILDRDEIIDMAFPNVIELPYPQREYDQWWKDLMDCSEFRQRLRDVWPFYPGTTCERGIPRSFGLPVSDYPAMNSSIRDGFDFNPDINNKGSENDNSNNIDNIDNGFINTTLITIPEDGILPIEPISNNMTVLNYNLSLPDNYTLLIFDGCINSSNSNDNSNNNNNNCSNILLNYNLSLPGNILE